MNSNSLLARRRTRLSQSALILNASNFSGHGVSTPKPLLKSLKGQPKPYQHTIIRMQTARHLAYLETRGLADFTGCNLVAAPNKYPKHIDGDKVRMVPVTDGSPTAGV